MINAEALRKFCFYELFHGRKIAGFGNDVNCAHQTCRNDLPLPDTPRADAQFFPPPAFEPFRLSLRPMRCSPDGRKHGR